MNLAKQEWATTYGEGIPPQPRSVANGWFLRFPDTGSVNYVTTWGKFQNRADVSRLVLSYRIGGTPNAKWRAMDRKGDEGLEPNFRPMLMAHMSGSYGRWWPTRGIELKRGRGSTFWNLDPSEWTSVYGERADKNETTRRFFEKCIRRAIFGLTFGGGNNYGHGVQMASGQASLLVTKFQFI